MPVEAKYERSLTRIHYLRSIFLFQEHLTSLVQGTCPVLMQNISVRHRDDRKGGEKKINLGFAHTEKSIENAVSV